MRQKIFCSLIALLLVGSLVSCKADVPQPGTAPTNVMQIGQGISGSKITCFNEPSVERLSITQDAAKAGKTATISFAGKEYHLEYQETRQYVIGDVIVDQYRILNSAATDGNACVELLPDGKILAIKGEPLYRLSIEKDWTAEQVRPVLEERLKNEVDFSQYSDFRWGGAVGAQPDSFKCYNFCWYHEKNGFHLGNYLQINVWEDGTVDGIILWENAGKSFAQVSDTVRVADYLPEIEEKLTAFYADHGFTLKSFEIQEPALIQFYQGQYHIQCTAVSQLTAPVGDEIVEAPMHETLLIRIA